MPDSIMYLSWCLSHDTKFTFTGKHKLVCGTLPVNHEYRGSHTISSMEYLHVLCSSELYAHASYPKNHNKILIYSPVLLSIYPYVTLLEGTIT